MVRGAVQPAIAMVVICDLDLSIQSPVRVTANICIELTSTVRGTSNICIELTSVGRATNMFVGCCNTQKYVSWVVAIRSAIESSRAQA